MPLEKIAYPVVVELSEPIAYGEELISELRFKRAKAKHLRDINLEAVSIGALLDLAAKLSGQPDSIMDELDVADLEAVCNAVEKCLPSSLTTSTKQ